MSVKKINENYKVSRQLKEAMFNLENIVANKDYKVIETQDILMAVLSVQDTGIGYALGNYSITRSQLQAELDKSERNYDIEASDKINELYNASLIGRRRVRDKIVSSPITLIKEQETNNFLAECEKYPLSELSKQIFDFAEEMRVQNTPDGVIDSYWLLIGMAQEPISNAHSVITKQYIANGNYCSEDTLKETFSTFGYRHRRTCDGKLENEREEKAIQDSQIFNKLNNPNYSILEDISTDLTLRARNSELMKVIGRDEEIRKIEIALTRRDKNNVVLLGEGGVGKSAIVDGLANKIVSEEVPSLRGKRILQFSMNSLYSVTRGSNDRAILRFIEEIKREKDIVLFVDEIHMLGNNKSLTDAFKPIMARGDFRIIGATTPNEWRDKISHDKALVRRFEQIVVDEPNIEEAIEIVKNVSPVYENYHHVNFIENSIELSVRLAKKYLKNEKLPDSALTILDNAGALIRIEAKQEVELLSAYQKQINKLKQDLKEAEKIEYNEVEVDKIRKKINDLVITFDKSRNDFTTKEYSLKVNDNMIKKVVEQKSKTEVSSDDLNVGEKAQELEKIRLVNLKDTLSKRVIGQEEAINTVSEAVIRAKTGFRNPNRPIGVFLFLGTSGVGKTETAKVLSKELSGSERDLIRFDMSEYQQPHEVSKLIGAPPGYAGYYQGGLLTSAVSSNPNAVILFDEIEKAHPKIYDLMLQVFDDGHLTDSQGNKVDFTNTIIILTSNLGLKGIAQNSNAGFERSNNIATDDKLIHNATMKAVKEFFRPELLNRIDNIVSFKSFTKEEIKKITSLLLQKEKELIEEQGYKVDFSNKAIELISNLTYDPINGARPIRREITKLIENPLSEKIIKGLIKKGDRIKVGVKYGNLDFKISQ